MNWDERVFEAVRTDDVDLLRQALQEDPESANARDENGVSALITAAYYGRKDIAQMLLDAGAKVDIFAAAALGLIDRLDILVSAGPESVSSYSPDGWTPLALSAFFGQADAAVRLLQAGADIGKRSTNAASNMPLHAAVAGKHADVTMILLDAGADINVQDGGGWTPVHIASHEGPLSLVRLLLDRGADPTIANNDGETPLVTAEKQGLPEIVALLRRVLPTG